jgi:polyhydroxybutyrate depolymerase
MNKNIKILFTLAILLLIVFAGFKIRDRYNGKNNFFNNDVFNKESTDKNQTHSLKSGDYRFKIINNNIERYYLLHVPNSYDNKPTPLILAFHGGAGSAEHMAEQYDLISKSDKEGFAVAFLNGASRLPSGKIATWNAGECCGYAVSSDSDDVDFVKLAIDDIKNKINVEKIYATGMSNGGMLSHRLACDMPELFTAIAAVAGTNNYNNCNPKKPISVLHIHSLIDQHVLFEGGCGPDCKINSETEFNSVSNTISGWVKRNNCNSSPERVFNNNGAYCDLYTECSEGVQVKLCVTDDGGHSWPGLKTESDNPLEKYTPSQKISATYEIWNFFKAQ